jgi:hypothetical protein
VPANDLVTDICYAGDVHRFARLEFVKNSRPARDGHYTVIVHRGIAGFRRNPRVQRLCRRRWFLNHDDTTSATKKCDAILSRGALELREYTVGMGELWGFRLLFYMPAIGCLLASLFVLFVIWRAYWRQR